MIAMKREVAAVISGFFRGANVKRPRSAISAGKPDGKSLYRNILSAKEQINV